MSEIVVYVRSQPQLGDQIVALPTLYQLKKWWSSRRIKVVARDDVGGSTRRCPGSMNSFAHPPSAITCAA